MKLFFSALVFLFLSVVVFAGNNYNKDFSNDWDWNPILVKENGVVVAWQEKYGTFNTDTCIGFWISSDKQKYLLTWKNSKQVIILTSNTNSLSYKALEK